MVRRPQETSVLVLRGPLDEKTELLISSGETVSAKLPVCYLFVCLCYTSLHIFIIVGRSRRFLLKEGKRYRICLN